MRGDINDGEPKPWVAHIWRGNQKEILKALMFRGGLIHVATMTVFVLGSNELSRSRLNLVVKIENRPAASCAHAKPCLSLSKDDKITLRVFNNDYSSRG